MKESDENKMAYDARYFGRVLATTCYELLNDNARYVMFDAIKSYRNKEEVSVLMDRISAQVKECNLFFNTHKNQLQFLRNNSICHKDGMTGFEQWDYISKFDLNYIAQVTESCIDINTKLVDLFMELITYLLKSSPYYRK